MRSEQEAVQAVERYADTVRRVCALHLKNHADTEDIFQTVFLKYVLSTTVFESQEHEKAWFIRVTVNACRDLLKSFFRSRTVSLDALPELPAAMPPDHREVLEAVLSLPGKNTEMWSICTIMRHTPPRRSAGFWGKTSTRSTHS